MQNNEMVMAKDRYRLSRLKHGKHQDLHQYEQLLAHSQRQVAARKQRLPEIHLNQDLPVSQYADKLIQAIQKHQVIIVAGETGSGKTTQLPQIAMLAGRGLTGLIGHTQPRRLAARSVSQRIAEELGQPLGHTVSFKVRFNEQGNQDSLIRLMTDGILLAELGHDRFLSKYDTIIIDEAHERSLNIDFILGYIKNILPKRPDLKVIVTSATLDVNRFSQYFHNAPIFEVEGRSFPVEVRYRPISELTIAGSDDDDFDDFEENLPLAVVQAVEECFADADEKGHPEHADILIFSSTEQEIRELQETLQKHGPRHTEILPLFARLGLSEQQKIFSPTGKGRRIIIATNVAETALTVPNIRYVIDSGFARISRYSYRSRVQRLPIEAISQAAANQRKGRCGRIAPGVCIRLYSEDDFLGRPEFTEPEIKRTNLASVILQMQSLGLGQLEDFDFIEPPDHRLVNDGRKLLIELGAYQEHSVQSFASAKAKNKGGLTKVGQIMAKMPIDPRLARMLVGGAHFGVLAETLIIVSALAVQDPRERPADKQMQADQKHALFREGESDFLFYLKLWQTLMSLKTEHQLSENKRRQFARQHFLSWLRLREWRQTYQQLKDMTLQLGMTLNEKQASYENLHRALLTGLLSFIAQKTDERNIYQAVRQQKAKVFPASTLHKSNTPWVMAFEMVETSQVYLRTLAKIEPEWILLAARDLLKYHYFEPHWSKKSGIVNAYAQISLFGLIIQPKQLVNFEKVDQDAAHEIFVRDALVSGNLGINPAFLQHNLLKLQEIERVEDKLRRRDLVVDEETLYQFYVEKIPKEIASRRSFEDWCATVESQNPRFLYFNEEDLWLTDRPTTAQFPDQLKNGQLKLAVSYHFDPSHDEDGATVTIPLQALSQVDPAQWSWGIAGWRQDLIEALLKSLSKDKRRLFVPIPDTACRLMQQIQPSDLQKHIRDVLAFLLRGEGIQAQDFNFDHLPTYLLPFIKVIDERKRIIEKGRNLEELQARCRVQTIQPVKQLKGEFFEFPVDFHFESEQKVSGVVVQNFQALVPVKAFADLDNNAKTGVVIQQFHDLLQAQKQHREGILQLVYLQLGDAVRQLKKQISKPLAMAFSPLGEKAKLEKLLIYATLQMTITDNATTQVEFNRLLEKSKQTFLQQGQKVLSILTDIFTLWQKIRQSLLTVDFQVFERSINDIEDQLDLMRLGEFVYQIAPEIWLEYPRYLKALDIRLERLPNNLARDEDAIVIVDPWMDKLFNVSAAKDTQIYVMVEELRISLFAQPMKTKIPISESRLQKAWVKLDLAKK
ncbi:ATP-dependent RNA helicase HrpA [Acinetobacter qingfengensis]|uniref:ATP-dependent RNA helicase HrpA n=1 Tax=Acinetobacter qingfengensis TaxID=1262585 RepID=A0A1E7QYW5_9GAMM|nr:ATP-dependent RNA helicase HrpA [Acinetobacter qingfengensis]KAA8731020.1 ATP-dependent RNA helicase HrpA [Acinetobacter qingfengensis]OEY92257.1 ATP-dependent RNA helicase HrpA [Acinetobacter qingfengensis]